jgi:hypothetical protein
MEGRLEEVKQGNIKDERRSKSEEERREMAGMQMLF